MTLRYTYHSEHHTDKKDRWVHFLLFAAAFLLLSAGGYELFLFLTDWNGAEEDHSYYYLVFALGYILLGLLLAYAGVRHLQSGNDHRERFVRVDEKTLSWNLTQNSEVEKVDLSTITSFGRPNVRDLVLQLRGGGQKVLPIYLIDDENKQAELLSVLETSTVA